MSPNRVPWGADRPCWIVAEISSNHGGDKRRACNLIRHAAWAGANAVKFQAYTVAEMIALRGEGAAPAPWHQFTLRDLYTQSQTPISWWADLFAEAQAANILLFASVFGRESLAHLEALHCPVYKIAAADSDNPALLKQVRATRKPLIISHNAPPAVTEGPNEAALWCPPGYPPHTLALSRAFHAEGFLGFSCHRPEPVLGACAVACGARILEFHLMDDTGGPFDHAVSLTPRGFRDMVLLVREAERALA